MRGMLFAKAAILAQLHAIGRVFLVLHRVVIALFALCARKRDLCPHSVRTSIVRIDSALPPFTGAGFLPHPRAIAWTARMNSNILSEKMRTKKRTCR